MKKYVLLNYLFRHPNGLTANALSQEFQTALPNIYTYLKELKKEGYVKKASGKYFINLSNNKVKKLILLRETFPKDYLFLISPEVKKIIQLLSKKFEAEAAKEFGSKNIIKIKHLHALKIVLITKNKPIKIMLRINEPIVKTLLDYFNIKPKINTQNYSNKLQKLKIIKKQATKENKFSDKQVKKMCDKYFKQAKDWFLNEANKYSPDKRVEIQLLKTDEATKQYTYYLNNLPKEIIEEITKQWKYKYTYNTNKIEGNNLTLEEITNYITTGTAPKHAKKKDLNETINTLEAIQWVLQNKDNKLDENLIKTLHYLTEKNIEKNAGKYKQTYNLVGNQPTTPPSKIQKRMKELIKWYKQNKNKHHPFILASIIHQQFVMIHPFLDGNGRTARLLFNLILLKNNYHPLIFEVETKEKYYQAIENKNLNQFLTYTTTLYIQQYLK